MTLVLGHCLLLILELLLVEDLASSLPLIARKEVNALGSSCSASCLPWIRFWIS